MNWCLGNTEHLFCRGSAPVSHTPPHGQGRGFFSPLYLLFSSRRTSSRLPVHPLPSWVLTVCTTDWYLRGLFLAPSPLPHCSRGFFVSVAQQRSLAHLDGFSFLAFVKRILSLAPSDHIITSLSSVLSQAPGQYLLPGIRSKANPCNQMAH